MTYEVLDQLEEGEVFFYDNVQEDLKLENNVYVVELEIYEYDFVLVYVVAGEEDSLVFFQLEEGDYVLFDDVCFEVQDF